MTDETPEQRRERFDNIIEKFRRPYDVYVYNLFEIFVNPQHQVGRFGFLREVGAHPNTQTNKKRRKGYELTVYYPKIPWDCLKTERGDLIHYNLFYDYSYKGCHWDTSQCIFDIRPLDDIDRLVS